VSRDDWYALVQAGCLLAMLGAVTIILTVR